MPDRWHSVDEVSEHLGVVPETVYRWIAAGRLPAHRIGRLWKFQIPEVDVWIREGRMVEEGGSGSSAKERGARSSRRHRQGVRVAR